MTDKKKIKIIKMVLAWLNGENEYQNIEYNKFSRSKFDYGICGILYFFEKGKIVTSIEKIEFDEFIMDGTKRRYKLRECFIFMPGAVKPRVNYLNKLLKKLEA